MQWDRNDELRQLRDTRLQMLRQQGCKDASMCKTSVIFELSDQSIEWMRVAKRHDGVIKARRTPEAGTTN
jgi:hypothetical protein